MALESHFSDSRIPIPRVSRDEIFFATFELFNIWVIFFHHLSKGLFVTWFWFYNIISLFTLHVKFGNLIYEKLVYLHRWTEESVLVDSFLGWVEKSNLNLPSNVSILDLLLNLAYENAFKNMKVSIIRFWKFFMFLLNSTFLRQFINNIQYEENFRIFYSKFLIQQFFILENYFFAYSQRWVIFFSFFL